MSAGVWAFGLRIAIRILILVRTVILARLLVPEDFGLMAIATLSILLLDQLTQPHFESALVQRRGNIGEYLDTVWTVQVIRAAFVAGLLLLTAPLIAQFFGAPEAEPIIRVLSLALLIRGVANVGTVEFWRDLRMDRLFVLEISDKLVDVVVSVAAAIVLRNVWALVLGILAGAVVKMVASYILHPYRPRFNWARGKALQLFGFGKWVWVSTVLAYVNTSLDDILVGRLLGVSELGLYRMAYNFSQAVATEFAVVTSQVAFPTYSELQDERDRLSVAYLGTLHLVAFLAFPVAIGTALVATDLTIGLLGQAWAPMIPTLRLLSVAGLARALYATTSPLFQATGNPKITAGFAAAQATVLVVLLAPAINTYGLEGAAGAVALTGVVIGVAALIKVFGFVKASFSDVTQTVGYPILNTAVMAFFVVLAMRLLPNRPSALSFVLLAAVGMLTYSASVAITVKAGGYVAIRALIGRVKGLGSQTSSDPKSGRSDH